MNHPLITQLLSDAHRADLIRDAEGARRASAAAGRGDRRRARRHRRLPYRPRPA